MEKHTEREKNAWLYWIRDHFDEMTLTEWYLQSIATEVRRGYVKDAKKIKMEDLHLSFEGEKKPVIQDKSILSKISQARWFGITGFKKKKG
jgi:hypothetical protein